MQFKPIVVIVVLLLVVASLLVAGCTTTRNEQTVSANSTANQASNQNSPQLTVTATSLGSSSTLSSSYGTPTAAAANNKFVTYAMYFQNMNGKGVSMGNPTEVKLRDTKGNIYSYDSFTYSLQQQVNGVTLKGLSVETNTQPGDNYSGLIAFQMPTNATPKSLTYDDYTNKITVNL
jgi:uncharacterized protein YcfL